MLDVDPDHGGVDSLRTLVDQHGQPPAGLRTRTGSGGWHLYFAHPGIPVRNSAGRLGAGLDIRGDGGYVIAPPSNHLTGGVYQFIDADAPVPAMPDWLNALVRPQPSQRVAQDTIRVSDTVDAWVRAAVLGEVSRMRAAPEGCRNATLNRAAFSLGQIAATGIIDADTVQRLLTESALGVGLGEREIDATIRSGLAAGSRHPRWPRGADVAGIELSMP